MIARARVMRVNDILIKGKATPSDILEAIEYALLHEPG
jgi:hypothetical protein